MPVAERLPGRAPMRRWKSRPKPSGGDLAPSAGLPDLHQGATEQPGDVLIMRRLAGSSGGDRAERLAKPRPSQVAIAVGSKLPSGRCRRRQGVAVQDERLDGRCLCSGDADHDSAWCAGSRWASAAATQES